MTLLPPNDAPSLLRELSGLAAVLAAGAGAVAWSAIAPRSQLFGATLRRTGRSDAVALTFDDGPNPALTPRLLRLLDENKIRATFFLIGRYVRNCPSLVQEIAAAGHTIGNHTDTHPNLFWLSPSKIAAELARCQDAIVQACGQQPVWMRPPFGYRGPQLFPVVRRAGFRGVVMWSRLAWDWKPQPVEKLIFRLRRVRGGDIVLLHDGDHRHQRGNRNLTLAGLDYWLPLWKGAGLQFVTLDDLAARSAPAPALREDSSRAPLTKSKASGN
ncbi:MAG: polysaccharide deacetylase family protein [Acidobacteria bacterium]|nr:polysaccharide deacetylase family protein [Acidobacteriota bacterium]